MLLRTLRGVLSTPSRAISGLRTFRSPSYVAIFGHSPPSSCSAPTFKRSLVPAYKTIGGALPCPLHAARPLHAPSNRQRNDLCASLAYWRAPCLVSGSVMLCVVLSIAFDC